MTLKGVRATAHLDVDLTRVVRAIESTIEVLAERPELAGSLHAPGSADDPIQAATDQLADAARRALSAAGSSASEDSSGADDRPGLEDASAPGESADDA